MSTERFTIDVAGLPIGVARKPIKNLHIAVHPPDGRVRVSAPEHFDDDAVRLAVVDRLAWIRRQRALLTGQPRQAPRRFVSGETHYVWGRRYRLRVVETDGRPGVDRHTLTTLRLLVPRGAESATRQRILERWYRDQLKGALPAIVARWEAPLGISVREWRVRRMRTKWGTCNAVAGRIWLNLTLARMPPGCLEYVVVHEMVHLLEENHSERFERLLDAAMPNWRQHRDELLTFPLPHETWPASLMAAGELDRGGAR